MAQLEAPRGSLGFGPQQHVGALRTAMSELCAQRYRARLEAGPREKERRRRGGGALVMRFFFVGEESGVAKEAARARKLGTCDGFALSAPLPLLERRRLSRLFFSLARLKRLTFHSPCPPFSSASLPLRPCFPSIQTRRPLPFSSAARHWRLLPARRCGESRDGAAGWARLRAGATRPAPRRHAPWRARDAWRWRPRRQDGEAAARRNSE